jgi:phage-related holin
MKNSFRGLRAAGRIALLLGAAGSISLLFHASQHPPLFLLVLFVIWVLGPFVALGVADRISKRWSNLTRKILYIAMLVVALSTLSVYGDDAVGRRTAHPAFVYVVVPPVSVAFIAIALLIAAVLSGPRSSRSPN